VLGVAALLLLGMLMVYSASQLSVPGDPGYWFRKQLVWAALGIVALVLTARLDYHWWQRVSLRGMLLALTLLVVVLKVGHTTYGAQRWLSVGLFSFQPSELAKLALVIYVADWLAGKGERVASFAHGLVPFALVTGVVLALVLMQNDMGTAIIIALLAFAMFYAAGANVLQLAPTLALGGVALAALVARSGFRRARVDALLHPLPPGCADPASYQVCQGLISLGSGGVFGRGLGDSVQKAGYLPNPFTDSIFAVIGEELGLVGCALVVALFAALAYRGFRVGRRAPDAYGALLACGITSWLVAQALVNVGSVVDATPFTGVPLPFVSFGGSSLVVSLAAVGILLNISRTARRTAKDTTMLPSPLGG
jgi:cell division protein FtsW